MLFYQKGNSKSFAIEVNLSLKNGPVMVFDLQNKHEIWMFFNLFNPALSTLMNKILRSGDIFIDCGANIGYYTFSAVPMVGQKGKIIAIDPNPYCIKRIQKSIIAGDYKNISVIQAGIAESGGLRPFNVTDDPMYSTLADSAKMSWTSGVHTIQICVNTLDDIIDKAIDNNPKKIRLLKLDIEGAEVAAIQGASKALRARKIDFVFVEMHEPQLALLGYSVEEFHDNMKKYGYRSMGCKEKAAYIYVSPDVTTEKELVL